VVKAQPLEQTSQATQTPFEQAEVAPEHTWPQLPQLAGSLSVFVHVPGAPQQSGVPLLQAAPLPH
jgi:hypothetical protein